MSVPLEYKDTVTIVSVSSAGYSSNKTVVSQEEISCTFLQDTSFIRTNFRDDLDSDAVIYPDPKSDFVLDNFNRLEGMYILAPLFGAANADSWYKITQVTVNRDHLLNNRIDNIECLLKKTRAIDGVS